MRRLSLLPSAPFYPTASELRIAGECVAPWALGLPEERETNEWADKGKWCHSIAESIAKGDTHQNAIGDLNEDWCYGFAWAEVEAMLRRDALACKSPVVWCVEKGIKWRSDGFDDEAALCERAPGERLRGWFSGTADLVYVRADGLLVVADWKFGPREHVTGEPAKESCQGFFLALAFATLLEVRGSSAGVVVARFERRMVREDGVEVDGYDITQGELDDFAAQLGGLAERIENGVDAAPKISAACGKCKAKVECSAWKSFSQALTFEHSGLAYEGYGIPETAEDARVYHFAAEALEHVVGEFKRLRDAYILSHADGISLGLGMVLKAIPQSKRAVVSTPEAMDLIEAVAGKSAIVVERTATCDSIKKAVRDAAGKGIESTADRNKAKAKAEAESFARLIEGGAIRESGKTYVVREVRTSEEE